VDNHRQDDFRPLVYRTRDNGATWTLAVAGLPADHFVSVVRADPVRTGLLYAGTEVGVYVSYDDGTRWQPLQLNLPTAWVRDLLVHGDDLIAATQGRAIWVLDNVAPLRQSDAMASGAKMHLFKPATAMRLRQNQNHDTPLPGDEPAGTNPPTGAMIDYWLATPAKRVELEIRDAAGALVRRIASDAPEPAAAAERYFTADWLKPAAPLSAAPGMHRFVWNLRYPQPRTTEFEYSIATAFGTGVQTLPAGPLAAPGEYRVVLRVDGRELSAPLTVAMDPRVAVDSAALAQALRAARDAQDMLARHYAGAAELEYVQERVMELRESQARRPDVLTALDAFDARVKPLTSGSGDLPGNLNLDAIGGLLRSIETDIEQSDRAPTEPQLRALAETRQRLDRALATWSEAKGTDLPKLNARLKAAAIAPIVIPAVDRIKLSGPSASREVP
jgi:hypothetical protein